MLKRKFLLFVLLILFLFPFKELEPPHRHTTQDLYEWEERTLQVSMGNKLLLEEEARNLISRIAKDYNIKEPKLSYQPFTMKANGGMLSIGSYSPIPHRISIYYGGDNLVTILHECAHAIHYKKLSKWNRIRQFIINNSCSHNSEFTSFYFQLLVKYGGFNAKSLVNSMCKHKIKSKYTKCK